MSDSEFVEGYRDGRNLDSPEPSANRSHRYRHSFAIGRAELANKPIPYPTAIRMADEARQRDQSA